MAILLAWSKNNNNSPGFLACLVGALPVLMLDSNWVTQDLLRQSLRESTFCFSSCCFVRWSNFLEDERGQRVLRREGLRARWVWRRWRKRKRPACFDYTSPTQIERCHARMRRFSNAATDQSQNRQMNTCSHKHTERVLAYGAPPPPPTFSFFLLIWMLAPWKVAPVIVKKLPEDVSQLAEAFKWDGALLVWRFGWCASSCSLERRDEKTDTFSRKYN